VSRNQKVLNNTYVRDLMLHALGTPSQADYPY
jgi:hypothetical protein